LTMSTLSYAREKLGGGIMILATHPGPIKERLIAAFHAFLAQVVDTDMPEDAQQKWREIIGKVTTLDGTPQSGKFQPSIQAMAESEVVQLAEDIVSVEALVCLALDFRTS